MGTRRAQRTRGLSGGSRLASALFTLTQQRVLALLFGKPDRSFFATEVIALAGSGRGAVQRELARLEAAGLITSKRVGKQKHYQANSESPIFGELHAIVLKTAGLADVLRAALAPLASDIQAAFVYGSVAKNSDTASSDIDLLILSDRLHYGDVFSALEDATRQLRRQVHPSIIAPNDLPKSGEDSFLSRVLAQPKIWIIGEDDAVTTRKPD